MLYYFRSELQVLRLGSNITTRAKYLKFGREALVVPPSSVISSGGKSLYFPEEVPSEASPSPYFASPRVMRKETL